MAAAGFASPAILFLNTWDSPERSYCKQIFRELRNRGYTRYVEPCSGGFAMPLVAADAGWAPEQMEASDVSLFSSIVGTMLDDGDFASLDIRVDGEPVELPDEVPSAVAAHLLWLQLLLRTQARPDVPYWRAMIEDLVEGRERHVGAIEEKLKLMQGRLGGLKYRPADLWPHIEAVADDPHTVISINPPTYKAGFERFFDTKGRLTWAVPEYDIFDPVSGNHRLTEVMDGAKALIVAQQQKEPGDCSHERPVFARDLSMGQYVYLWSNRPDEVFAITGGMKVAPRRAGDLTPSDLPPLSRSHEVRPDSRIDLIPVKAAVADYYRGLWMHRLAAAPGSGNILVAIDGHAAGIMGYSSDPMARPYPGVPKPDRWLMRFAFGAPHEQLRLTRLVTMLCMNRSTAQLTVTPASAILFAASKGLVTVEYTRHPEAKGLRGLMKMVSRRDHEDGHALVYHGDWADRTPEETLKEFLTKEKKWLASRK